MNSRDIRKKYIEFFIKQGHKEISPAPLLALNDPTLLFVNSGMFPLVPYLSGMPHVSGKKLVDYQRSFRTGDIEEVGDHRHTTFFEMLGNWSLGDYFKKEQLEWWFEFIVEEVKLDPNKLYQSVFAGDENAGQDIESIETLQKIFKKYGVTAGVGPATLGDGGKGPGKEIDFSKDRIFPYVDKNWWKRGDAIGELGGPDSETFYDTGKKHDPKYGKYCHINCDCGRFIEIGNSVFMQYKKVETGWAELPQKNVDFGGGLERLTMVSNGINNVFQTDLFADYINYLEKKSGKKYEDRPDSFEIVADHLRASTFLIADGGVPGNKDQGYFIRRLIRRSAIHLRRLGLENTAFIELIDLVIKKMGDVYPHLINKQDSIKKIASDEMLKFGETLKNGMKYFEGLKVADGKYASEDIFTLITTYGFPIEIIRELAKEKSCVIDETAINKMMEDHKTISKVGSEKKFKSGLADSSEVTMRLHTATHLLHQALRQVLGNTVEQRGSNITPERLRFDFSYPQKMTKEQIEEVENIVNTQIMAGLQVFRDETTVAEAKNAGAIGLFGDKYGERISVYSVGASIGSKDKKPFSREICTGPHVTNTSELGHFKILKEEASSAGIRRIKAIVD